MISDEFNVSESKLETQKRQHEAEKEQIKDNKRKSAISDLKNDADKKKAADMLKNRDHLKNQLEEQKKRQIDAAVKEKMKNVQPKHQHNIKPPKGVVPPSPKRQEEEIRTKIKMSLGVKLDEGIGKAIQGENQKLDEFVQKAKTKQREETPDGQRAANETKQDYKNRKTMSGDASRSKREQIKTNGEDITKDRSKGSDEGVKMTTPREAFQRRTKEARSQGRSGRGRGRSRARD